VSANFTTSAKTSGSGRTEQSRTRGQKELLSRISLRLLGLAIGSSGSVSRGSISSGSFGLGGSGRSGISIGLRGLGGLISGLGRLDGLIGSSGLVIGFRLRSLVLFSGSFLFSAVAG
jgi:hypothetical protein